MNRLFYLTASLIVFCLAVSVAGQDTRPQPKVTPFHRAGEHELEYHGPGRSDSPPSDITEVRIGYFGPSDPDNELYGGLWKAAQVAIGEINRNGGFRGLPFRLVPGWSGNPWGSGVREVTRMIYDEDVWAVIGSVDGTSTHLAEQVVAKARVTLINPVSPDETVNLANVPWMFSCLPGEQSQVPKLVSALLEYTASRPFAVISAIDHDSRVFAREFNRHLSLRQVSPSFHFNYAPNDQAIAVLSLLQKDLAALVVIAGPLESAKILKVLRRQYAGQVFGTQAMGLNSFLRACGDAAQSAIFPYPISTRPDNVTVLGRFARELATAPDFAEIQMYDAVHLLAEAIRESGLNRARIRDQIRKQSPWKGIGGVITWDSQGQNSREIHLATIRNGVVEPLLEPR